MSPWKTSPSAAVSFLQTDCVCSFQPGEPGFSEQTGGACIEVDGKQIQRLCLNINAAKCAGRKISFKLVQSLPKCAADVSDFELLPVDNF